MVHDFQVSFGIITAGEDERTVNLHRLSVVVLLERDRIITSLYHRQPGTPKHAEDHLFRHVLEHVTDIESEFFVGP